MNKTFKSKVTRWLQGDRSVRVGTSGRYRPNVYVAMNDGGGERYVYLTTDDARQMGIALIEAAAQVDAIRAKPTEEAA